MAEAPTRLLLVEDSVADAGLIQAAIQEVSSAEDKFELVHVSCLADALERLEQPAFDLVLLDLSLPDARHMEALGRIRDAAPNLPVVIVSGLDNEKPAIEALRRGAQDYLVKSDLDSRMLVRVIRNAIEHKRVVAQLEEQRTRQAVLHELNLAITSTLDLNSMLRLFLDRAAQLLPDFAFTIRLQDDDLGELQPLACRNLDEADWKKILPTERRVERAKRVMAARAPIVITEALTHATTSDLDFLQHNGLVSYVGAPLVARGDCLGVIGFYTRKRHEFTDDEVEFLATLAGQAAVAIHNSQFYKRLKTANEALEKTLEAKGVLAGVMAHELKTPLQVIMGAAGLLSGGLCGPLNDEQRERVRAIEASADELRELIESTLSMASLEEGKATVIISEVCVRNVLTELKTEFSETFRRKNVELQINMPAADFTIKTDRIKFKEIFRNLLENARKFTPQGKVTMDWVDQPDDGRVKFAVADTGIGIKKELLPRIFDLFYQAPQPTETESVGVGLGLSIVKRLVITLSGEIEVTSEIGKGTSFQVTFPIEVNTVGPD